MYLSRLFLDTRQRHVRRDLGDAYQLHRTVLAAFPAAPVGASAREHFGLLYRAEPFDRDPGLMRLLVQSAVLPDWSQLPPGYLGAAPDGRGNPAVRQIDAEYEHIRDGMQLIFRLRANPTRRIGAHNLAQGEQWRGKRVELRREEDLLEWLNRKGEQGGFSLVGVEVRPEVPDMRVTALEKVHGHRTARGDTATMPLHFGAALFEGRLEVIDQAAFRGTLSAGIGSGKAFGFGLLSVAAIQ